MGITCIPLPLRLAMTNRPDAICLVSDAMATAGTEMTDFTLGKAKITRQSGILTRADGTLAGADLTQAQAVRILAEVTKLPFHTCLKAAFDAPHRALTAAPNRLIIGQPTQLLHWQGETLIGPLGP